MNANRSGGGNTRPRKRRRGEDKDDDDGIDAIVHMIRELAEAERRLEILQRENLRRILANLPVRNTLKIHLSNAIMKILLFCSLKIRPNSSANGSTSRPSTRMWWKKINFLKLVSSQFCAV